MRDDYRDEPPPPPPESDPSWSGRRVIFLCAAVLISGIAGWVAWQYVVFKGYAIMGSCILLAGMLKLAEKLDED